MLVKTLDKYRASNYFPAYFVANTSLLFKATLCLFVCACVPKECLNVFLKINYLQAYLAEVGNRNLNPAQSRLGNSLSQRSSDASLSSSVQSSKPGTPLQE